MDSNHLDFMAGQAEMTIDSTNTTTSAAMDLNTSSAQPFVQRPMDPAYMHPMMYPPNFASAPMVPTPYTGGGPVEAFASGNHPANPAHAKYESITDLISPSQLEFKYCPEMNAVLHIGKCAECVNFGMHLILPGNRINFIKATTAQLDAATEPLNESISKLTRSATTASKTIAELKDALQASQERAATLTTQRDDTFRKHDELLMEHRLLQKRVEELEQAPPTAPYRRAGSPSRNPRRHSPPRAGSRMSTPYDRPNSRRTTARTHGRPVAPAPTLQELDSEGDLVMASIPTSIRPPRMHALQIRLNNPRPCSAPNYRWRAADGSEIVGLPTTRAGTPYLPSDLGVGWCQMEGDATSIAEVHRRIDLLYRNRKTEIWRAAARSAFELRRLIHPLPEVMGHLIGLHDLRKSVWATINDEVADRASLTVISPGCRLHADGYAGLYTPDVQLWAVIHCISDVDPAKLTARTGRTVSSADLKKMVKDALCSDNYFGITPAELANGEFRLPRLAHYDGALDMGSIVRWLRDSIGMSAYMVHSHFRPFLRRAFETTHGAHHQLFSPEHLLPGEVVAPRVNDTLSDFTADCDWSPSHGPRGHSFRLTIESASEAPTNVLAAPMADLAIEPPASPSTPDTEMTDSGASTANAPTVAS